jgi:tetratricopeptide (TPR) repeat protein
LAWLYLAHGQYSEGDYQTALESYDRAASLRRISDYLQDQALLGRAYSLVGLVRCEEAETLFRRFIALSGPLPKDDALLAIGRCHEGAEDWETALLRYEEFLETYPESPFLTQQLRRTLEGLRQRVFLGK